MNRKLEYVVVSSGVIGTLVALLAWLFPMQPERISTAQINSAKEVYAPAELVISATGVYVQIKKGRSGRPYDGGNISGTGSQSIVYLPIGQSLHIKVSGTGVILGIERTIFEYVSIYDRGTGTQISEI